MKPSASFPDEFKQDAFKDEDLNRLQVLIYLIPVVGFFPALWTLYRQDDNAASEQLRAQRNASRLAVTLTLGWILAYGLLGAGTQVSDSLALPLLILSSLLTSGYFLASIWLMLRLWQHKPLRLPGISRLSDRLP